MENANTKTRMEETKLDEVSQEHKTIGIIAYVTIIGLIVAFVMNNSNKSEFGNYHIKQSLGIMLCGLALGIIGLIPILGWIINILGIFVLFYMWIMGLMNAINEKQKPVPILGEKFEEWFKNI